MLAGHVGEDAALLARRGDDFFAISATCSHYGGPGTMPASVCGAARRFGRLH
jgi:nitrite reductase/ring-hydroxylating ferredoxin subunit